MADRIEQQINNATAAIQKLNRQIANLQADLESGHWGTGQIQQMQAQLDKLNASLEKRTARRETLISKQDNLEAERLNKTIETTRRQLEYLRSEKTSRAAGNQPFLEFSTEQLEKEISKYERVLKSFQSRLAGKELRPSGAHTFTQDPNKSTAPIETPSPDDVERRINKAILGMPLTNAEVRTKVREAREIALNTLYGTPGAGEKGLRGTTIEGGFHGEKPFQPADSAAARDLERATNSLGNAEETESAKARKARLEAERLANLRQRIATDPAFKNYIQQLEAREMNINDIQSALNRGGGITQVTASRNMGGIQNKYQAYVNEQTGTSTPGLSSQFRTFGKDILRDIGQFTKWSIAIAAVYTPLQKLGELMTIMVDNESRLADATIAANVPFSKSGEIFDTVAVSANKAGESINTTIDAYTSAIRAAGRYNDEATKQVAAVKLLDDALILSKLSTLDQSESIDVLSAALLQSDRSLIQGEELLNKWVRVSQIANVSIDSLATGVAVLGDSAETVGLSIDQLNGLIAVLSEQSISGAKEAANTAKALVGAYQSDKAEAALNKYGVALRKTNGEVRGFLDIYQELARLRQQGVLSEAAVSEVALALGGGGVRRAKDASALINSTDRLNKIAQESAKITGQDTLAQDALAKKLETVQTANTRLANSFQELAQTLGTDGGLLDGFKTLVNLLTAATRGATGLFSVLGRSGPILTTFLTGMAALTAMSGGTKATLLARYGGDQFKGFLGGQAQFGGQGYGARLATDILKMNYRGAGVIGGAGVALQAGTNVLAGRNENALGNVAGGAIGAAIGTVLGGPIGLAAGANIGSAVGDAFVTFMDRHSEQLADYFLPKVSAGKKVSPQEELRGKTTQELLDTAYNSLGFLGKIQAYLKSREAFPNAQGVYEQYGSRESAAMDIVKKQNPALYQELYRQFQQQRAQLSAQTAISAVGTGAGTDALRKRLEEQGTAARQYQLGQLAQGKITTAEFGRVSEQISGFPAVSIKSVTAFGNEITKVNRDIQNTTEAYDAFLYIAQYGTQDQINLISQYSDDILTLQTYLEKLKTEPALVGAKIQLSFGDVVVESPEQLAKLIADYQKQGATALGVTLGQVQASQAQAVKLPPLVGDYNKPVSGRDQETILKHGLEIMNKFLVETGKTAEEIAKFKAGIETFYTAVDRGAGVIFEGTNSITQQFYDLGKAAAEAAGELENINNPIGFQKYDVPMATLSNLAQRSLSIGKNWQQKFNYDFKPEDQIAIDNQGIVQPLHADFKILGLLLEKLVDQGQKQLDGQYNIPEGATFWVPLTAAYYRNKGGDGMGGADEYLKNQELQDNSSATAQNTQALRELAQAFRGDRGYSRVAEANNQRVENTYKGDLGLSRRAIENAKAPLGYRGDLGFGRAATPDLAHPGPRDETTFQRLINELINSIKQAINGQFPAQRSPAYGGSYDPRPTGGAFKNSGATGQLNTTPTTKLDLKLSSNVNLLVDGRLLAQTMQSYLAQELLHTEQSGGTVTKRYII